MEDSLNSTKRLCAKGIDPKILAKILGNLDNAQIPAQLGGFDRPKEEGSLPLQGSDSTASGPASEAEPERQIYLTRNQLYDLLTTLSKRDKHILTALYKYRFLYTNQIQRLFFTEAKDKRSNTINANRMLKKLKEFGLIASLKRRSLGYRSGSISLIWHLTSAGYRLLNLESQERFPRKSFDEPSTLFLAHTLAIAETAVQITTICNSSGGDLNLDVLDPEPTCWRPYVDDGRKVFLKPDLYAVATTNYGHGDKYEDSWFIEMDLGTEAPTQVVEQCNAYLRYYNTGNEQRKKNVFPLVVWLVKDEARKQKLKQYIKENVQPQKKLFLVITPDQLGALIRTEIEYAELI